MLLFAALSSSSLIGGAVQSRSARVIVTNEMGRKSGHLMMCINEIAQ